MIKNQTRLQLWLSACLCMLATVTADAQSERTINVATPGTLPALIGDSDKNTITKLTLTGSLDGTDILFIREMAGSSFNTWEQNEEGQLAELDLSGATIVGGGAQYCSATDECYTTDNAVGSYMFYNCDRLTKLRLPNSATSICSFAIYDMDQLADLDLGTGISEIGQWGVCSNHSLRQLVVPQQVTAMGDYAFDGNEALERVQLGNQIQELPSNCFSSCSSLQEVVLHSQLKRIGDGAFSYCYQLKEIKLPASLTSIGESAFYRCDALEEINLGEGITELGNSAFQGCTALSKVHLPNSLATISESAFYGCRALTDINLDEQITAIGRYAFYNTGLERVKLPGKVERLEEYTFAECQNLREIELGKTVTYIGERALAGTALAGIEVPSQVEIIDRYALSNNQSLESVSIAGGVKSIGEWAFSYCPNIKSFVLPASVDQLGRYVFSNCTGLESAEVNCSVTALPDGLFEYCRNLHTVTIPQNLQGIGRSAFFECTSLPAFTIPGAVTELGSNAFSGCSSLSEIRVPEGVTSLPDNVFANCTSLQTASLPDNLTRIGERAFYYCQALKSIQVPASVEDIAGGAFENCQALESINWPEKATSIAWSTFRNCSSLKSISLPETITSIGGNAFESSGLTAFVVPSLVTALESGAFSGCANLESIMLPEGLLGIDSYCFQGCHSLKSITIPASVTFLGYGILGGCQALTEIHARPEETPRADGAFWGLDQQNCTLYVPVGCILAYQGAEGWKDFTNIVEEGAASDTTPLDMAEWNVLKQFYEQTAGSGWIQGWTFGDVPETTGPLAGVTSRGGHVVRIALPNNNLRGKLSNELLTLPRLTELDLSGNQLSGDFPSTPENLHEAAPLTYLDISGNPLTGNLGIVGEAFVSLTTLRASGCHFSELRPALPERITTVDIQHQTIDGETSFNQLINGETLDEKVPSIMRYNPDDRTYAEYLQLRLTDEQTDQRTWDVYMDISGDYSYIRNHYWSYKPEYRRENGLLLYATLENDQEHEMRVRFDFAPGDANFDTVLDIADMQSIINKALYDNTELFNYTAANLVADETINVQDVVADINLLLSQNIPTQDGTRSSSRLKVSNSKSKSKTQNSFVYVEDGQLVLNSTEPVAAFDIIMSTEGFEWLQPVQGFSYATKPYGQKLRVIGYSLSGTEIPAGRSVLAKVSAQRVIEAELVNAKAKPIGVVCNTLPTGIAAQQAGVNITTENRQIILNVQGSTPNGHWTVYTLTGQIVAQGTFEELSAGQTSITVPVAGQYMVKVTGPNLNIIKKIYIK